MLRWEPDFDYLGLLGTLDVMPQGTGLFGGLIHRDKRVFITTAKDF